MSGRFILHGSPHSLPTYRIALMLRLCRTGFTFRHVSFQRGMHRTPEFRKLSRWGQVPVMEYENRIFVQSAAILEYLADTLGCFGAAGVEASQHVREWLFWDADRLMPPLYAWYSVELGRRNLLPLEFDPVLVAEFDRRGIAALNSLDSHLSASNFLVEHTATIADICCYSDVAFARLSNRDFAPWPNVVAWAGRVEALPGFAKPFDLLAMEDAEIAS
jgi:glutathione S-transferase